MVLLAPFAAVAALVLVAGVLKLRSPAPASEALGRAGLRVPAGAVRILAAGEIALGAFCLAVPTRAGAAVLAATFAAFAVFLAWRGRQAGCGCFGEADEATGWLEVGLDVAAAAVAAAAAVSPPHGLVWAAGRLGAPVTAALVAGTAGAAYAAYLAFTALPGAWRSYGGATDG